MQNNSTFRYTTQVAMSAFAPTNIEKETLREYKTFRIGADDGSFKGMLIRDVG